jgi:prepilin-type N-terminal cleavage/methylation domain-containing protein
MNRKGFTLIELLVVIAIIGILSSIVLASLNTARAKGADAAIKSNLANIRPQAEILYDTSGNYLADSADCTGLGSLFVNTIVKSQIDAAVKASGGTGGSVVPFCAADDGVSGAGGGASMWAVAVQLKVDTSKSWCVDSSGYSNEIDTATGLITTGSTASCK